MSASKPPGDSKLTPEGLSTIIVSIFSSEEERSNSEIANFNYSTILRKKEFLIPKFRARSTPLRAPYVPDYLPVHPITHAVTRSSPILNIATLLRELSRLISTVSHIFLPFLLVLLTHQNRRGKRARKNRKLAIIALQAHLHHQTMRKTP